MKKMRDLNVITDLNDKNKLKITPLKGQKSAEKYREGSPVDLNKFRIAILVIIGILAPIIQEAFFNNIRLFGVKPNLAMVFVFTFAVVMNDRSAMIMGAAEGLYLDIIFGKTVGIFGLLFTLLGFTASLLGKKFKEQNVLSLAVAPGFFTAYTFAESFLSRISHMLSRTGTSTVLYENFFKHIFVRIIPVAMYDLIVFAILLYPMRFLWKVAMRKKMINKMTKEGSLLNEEE